MNSNDNKTPIKNDLTKSMNQNKLFRFMPLIVFIAIGLFFYFRQSSDLKLTVIDNSDGVSFLTGVKVTIDNKVIKETDDKGTLTFSGLSDGNHSLSFEKNGYNNATRTLTLSRNESSDLLVNLESSALKVKNNTLGFSSFMAFSKNNLALVSNQETKSFLLNNRSIADTIYLPENQNVYASLPEKDAILIIEKNTGKETIIDLESASKPTKLVLSSFRDKIFVLLEAKNNIATIDLSKVEVVQSSFDLSKYDGNIQNFFVNKKSNKLVLIYTDKVVIYSPLSGDSESVELSSQSLKGFDYIESSLFLISDAKSSLQKINLLSKNKEELNLPFQPTSITKSDKDLILASNDTIFIVNQENGSVMESFSNLGLKNISSIYFSSSDQKLYITENNSKEISIFDLNSKNMQSGKIDLDFVPDRIILQ